jgi:hypothetical protein
MVYFNIAQQILRKPPDFSQILFRHFTQIICFRNYIDTRLNRHFSLSTLGWFRLLIAKESQKGMIAPKISYETFKKLTAIRKQSK